VNVDPDLSCPHCGPVIVCRHTQYPFHPGAEEVRRTNLEKVMRERPEMRRFIEWLHPDLKQQPKRATLAPPAADVAKPGRNPAYVAKAIRAELEQLAGAREGTRNATLAKVAVAVFEFVKAGHADEAAVRAELERIALAIGLEPAEIAATLRHNWNKAQPRDVPAHGGARITEVSANQLRGAA
jgi:hypothetical protein